MLLPGGQPVVCAAPARGQLASQLASYSCGYSCRSQTGAQEAAAAAPATRPPFVNSAVVALGGRLCWCWRGLRGSCQPAARPARPICRKLLSLPLTRWLSSLICCECQAVSVNVRATGRAGRAGQGKGRAGSSPAVPATPGALPGGGGMPAMSPPALLPVLFALVSSFRCRIASRSSCCLLPHFRSLLFSPSRPCHLRAPRWAPKPGPRLRDCALRPRRARPQVTAEASPMLPPPPLHAATPPAPQPPTPVSEAPLLTWPQFTACRSPCAA